MFSPHPLNPRHFMRKKRHSMVQKMGAKGENLVFLNCPNAL